MLKQIISGGQTGVDRAALDCAIQFNISHGGWCPKNRKAEDGSIDRKYQLKETFSENYQERTEFNVRDSDGTLIILQQPLEKSPSPGTIFTITQAKNYNKPYLICLLDDTKLATVLTWFNKYKIEILNIAGPRASECEGIYLSTYHFLKQLYPTFLN